MKTDFLYALKSATGPTLVSIDIETMGLERTAEIFSAAIGWLNPDGTIESSIFHLDRFSSDQKRVTEDEAVFRIVLDRTLFNPQFPGLVLFHNLNFDVPLLITRFRPNMRRITSRQFCSLADTAAISRVLKNNTQTSHIDPSHRRAHSLKFLADSLLARVGERFRTRSSSFEEVARGVSLRYSDWREIERYNRNDVVITIQLYLALKDLLSPREWKYVEEIENPHSFNLLHLAFHGVPYDRAEADILYSSIENELARIQARFGRLVGRGVNLDSNRELSAALFYNHRLTYQTVQDKRETLKPLYVTDRDHAQIDLSTLEALYGKIKAIDQHSPLLEALLLAIRYVELSKSRSQLDLLTAFAKRRQHTERIFPNISARAASGRVTCSRPNLLGLPKKILKKSRRLGFDPKSIGLGDSHIEYISEASVRQIIRVPSGYCIGSIDINGLDLAIIADGAISTSGNSDFYWLNFIRPQFGEVIDSHFALLQRLETGLYVKAFADLTQTSQISVMDYWAKKPSHFGGKKGVWLIHKKTGAKKFLPFPDDGQKTERKLEAVRELSKKLNFATSYLIGAAALAAKLREVRNDTTSSIDAQTILDGFYDKHRNGFPEIREFQDHISNLVYRQGYAECPFGRRFYADVWDQLNAHHMANETISGQTRYEFVVRHSGRYWYVCAHQWLKENDDVISNLKVLPQPFGLAFRKVSQIVELPSWIFNQANEEDFQKRWMNYGGDERSEDIGEFELSRIAITENIDTRIQMSFGIPMEAGRLLESLLHDGTYLIRESSILFYRASTDDIPSRYFRRYRSLLRSAKKFFPNYCQGVAATVAKKALTHARKRIEDESDSAVILFFIHDQIDVMFCEGEEDLIKGILTEAVESDMSPFPLRFTGQYVSKGRAFS